MKWIARLLVFVLFLQASVLISNQKVSAAVDQTFGERPLLAAGLYQSYALKEDGTLRAWGYNNYGQLGDGVTTLRKVIGPVKNLTNVTAVTGGSSFGAALLADGKVWAWGYNGYGQLGDSTITVRKLPVQVSGLTNVTAISAGANHMLALKSDGTVWAWGYNGYGQLGDKTYTVRKTPIKVNGLPSIKSIISSFNMSFAIATDGSVWAWGQNSYGSLGDGTTVKKNVPVQISALSNVKSISAGYYTAMALKNDGTVYAWGYNKYGQVGDGTILNRLIPVKVANLVDVKTIANGAYHSLALLNDGSVWAWGYNNYGQLGDNTLTLKKLPTRVIGLDGVTHISSAHNHNLALKSDMTVASWGYNRYGALGDGTNINKKVPVLVQGLQINLPDAPVVEQPSEELPPVDEALVAATDMVGSLEDQVNAGLNTQAAIDEVKIAYEDALQAVTDLDNSSDKTLLVGRLEQVKQKIDAAQESLGALDTVAKATAAVEKAEQTVAGDLSTQVQIDAAQQALDEANTLVVGLPDGDAKTALSGRLNTTKQKITEAQAALELAKAVEKATAAVEKAEQAVAGDLGTQEQIDAAQQALNEANTLVVGLPDGDAKTTLSGRLNTAKQKITEAQAALELAKAIAKATAAVERAEQAVAGDLGTQEQIDAAQQALDEANTLVVGLPDGDAKTALSGRLNTTKQKIVEAQAALELAKAIAKATAAVEKAEQAVAGDLGTQEQIDAAQQALDEANTLVVGLPDGDAKTALSGRLNTTKQKIVEAQAALELAKAVAKATAAVEKAEQAVAGDLGTQEQIDAAQQALNGANTLVVGLPDGDVKTALSGRLNATKQKITDAQAALELAKAVAKATAAVEKAEQAVAGDLSTQEQINAAQLALDEANALVVSLPEGSTKAALSGRLNTTKQKIVDAQAALELAKAVAKATAAVEKAEQAVAGDLSTQEQIDAAQLTLDEANTLVVGLPDGDTKTALNSRLNAAKQKIVDAQAALELAKAVAKATAAVEKAEQAVSGDLSTQEQINAAQLALDEANALVVSLPEGSTKAALSGRLNTTKQKIVDAQAALELAKAVAKATVAVEKAEQAVAGDLSTQEQINAAQLALDEANALVVSLPEGSTKAALSGRLNAAKQKIVDAQAALELAKAVAKATAAVEKAEQAVASDLSTQDKVNAAQTSLDEASALVANVAEGAVKVNLQNRLAVVKKKIDAANQNITILGLLNKVTSAKYTTLSQFDPAVNMLYQAKSLIEALPEGNNKTSLWQAYNNARQKLINSLQAVFLLKLTGKPERISDITLEFYLVYVIEKVGALTHQDQGKVMSFVKPYLNNNATGNQINDILEKYLSNQQSGKK